MIARHSVGDGSTQDAWLFHVVDLCGEDSATAVRAAGELKRRGAFKATSFPDDSPDRRPQGRLAQLANGPAEDANRRILPDARRALRDLPVQDGETRAAYYTRAVSSGRDPRVATEAIEVAERAGHFQSTTRQLKDSKAVKAAAIKLAKREGRRVPAEYVEAHRAVRVALAERRACELRARGESVALRSHARAHGRTRRPAGRRSRSSTGTSRGGSTDPGPSDPEPHHATAHPDRTGVSR